MRIGILTHPQGTNYGGILQCYALSEYLKKLGHEPIVIRREPNKGFFVWRVIRTILKILHFPRYYQPQSFDKGRKIRPFVEKYLQRTKAICSQSQIKNVCNEYGFDAVIVGSDQVWRADYAMNFGYNYFLDFVPSSVRKISYAASLGLSGWRYTDEETVQIKKYLNLFDGMSVREEEAVELCKHNLGITPEWLLDPTMLLSADDYDRIVSPRKIDYKYVFVYWLGDKSLIADDISSYKQQGYEIVDINLRDEREQDSIEDWLSYIKYAECVITDSFHGCVFSLLFERQFIVCCNRSGGYGRIQSLFKSVGLEEKLNNQQSVVNYPEVNAYIKKRQLNSYHFLSNVLK